MLSKSLIGWLAVLLLFAGGTAILVVARGLNRAASDGGGIVLLDPAPLTEFTLTERSGQRFHSAELDGTVWVASFFFSACPQRCVKQNLKIQQLARKFGPRGVRFLSITCDPERDTPYVLAQYADRFAADKHQWLFLTGQLDYIQRLGKDIFKVSVSPDTHSERLITVDRGGQMRGYFHWDDPGQVVQFEAMLGTLLTEDRRSSTGGS